jgi:hypothetical protein
MKRIFLLLLLTFLFHGCEKDDICTSDTPTTPRLIIEFYDSINTSVLKQVANLKVEGDGANTALNFNLVSQIELPLKTNEDVTNYQLTINSTATTSVLNTDLIQINYTRSDIYISRACGFKTYFNLNLLNPVTQTNPDSDSVFWIKNIEIIKNTIQSEEDVHIKMYF